ncbi:MAG: dephospho-CoA kinase [Desulfobacteraceae bacterium]|nr:dephospho-CoA kinase [Desulfobacteraceae bacterium]
MVRIGLTGGPGSGKSTVAKIFKRQNTAFSDLDHLSRVAVEPGRPAFNKIVEYFGKSAVNDSGDLDRAFLRDRLIKNPGDKKVLEDVIHPEVFSLLALEEKRCLEAGERVFCVEAPLLFEAKMEHYFDCIVTVYCSRELQVKRVMERDGQSYESALGLIDSQISLDEKASNSDFVIYNESGVEELEKQVLEILNHLN